MYKTAIPYRFYWIPCCHFDGRSNLFHLLHLAAERMSLATKASAFLKKQNLWTAKLCDGSTLLLFSSKFVNRTWCVNCNENSAVNFGKWNISFQERRHCQWLFSTERTSNQESDKLYKIIEEYWHKYRGYFSYKFAFFFLEENSLYECIMEQLASLYEFDTILWLFIHILMLSLNIYLEFSSMNLHFYSFFLRGWWAVTGNL